MSQTAPSAGAHAGAFRIELDLVGDYEFRIRFDKESMGVLTTDEPPPLGHDVGPNPSRLLAAAVSNCLAASLLFCARRAKVPVTGMSAEANVTLVRNERKRLRVGVIAVVLRPRLDGDPSLLQGCLGDFEDFCVVTQSVRDGFDVDVKVEPAT
jgi:organic hydroperoxide reductase OsmC/OhrA